MRELIATEIDSVYMCVLVCVCVRACVRVHVYACTMNQVHALQQTIAE